MNEHTEGPWEVVPNHDAYVKRPGLVQHRIDQVGGLSGLAVALVIADCPSLTETGQAEANARLMAASPNYYEAMETMLANKQCGGDGWREGWDALKVAHARAKGEIL
jgi:hypothetical protein